MLESVAIIGGGPAGCSAALRCSQLGLHAVLFESGRRNRDKPCGDALVANAVAHAQAFGLTESDFRRLGGRPFDGIDLVLSAHGGIRELNRRGWVIPRALLDQALRDVISQTCDVRYDTSVRSLSITASGISLSFSTQSDRTESFAAAILATGASTKLSRMLDIDGYPRKGLAIRGYVPFKAMRNNLLFKVSGVDPVQYDWFFPLEEKANVGICRLDRCTAATRAEFRTLAISNRMTKFVGASEPLWSGSATMWHHRGGVVSCGDSAGLVDPLTGEGISAAFMSGEMAAQAIAGYLGGQGVMSLVNYSLRIRQAFSTKYGDARRIDLLGESTSAGSNIH